MSTQPLKSGYINKEGAQVLNWKRRFLAIERDRLTYYTKDNKKDKKGEILLQTIRDVNLYTEYKAKKYVFGIVTTSARTYYIQGSDDENATSWVNAIRAAIGKEPVTKEAAIAAVVQRPAAEAINDHNEPGSPRRVYLDDFVQLKVIGRGGFGRVLLVRKKDNNKVYAMKVLKKDVIEARGEVEHTRTERSVLSKLDHPFLAKLHWSFQTQEHLYFIMDFINGGELFHHLSREKRFTEERAKFYAAEIVSGMEYLHKAGIIYRDLKPENLLLNAQGHVVMTDFGLSKEGLLAKDSKTATFCGTPEYLAPEIIQGKDYTKVIDWWSVGTLIFEMLTGLPPFYSEDEENMYRKIMTADLVFPPGLSQEAMDIISKFLTRDPDHRLQNSADIRGHPWFRDINWAKLEATEIPTPFKPNVKSADDIGNIDPEFLEEDINAEGPGETPEGGGKVSKDAFMGFTFAADDTQ